MKFLLPLVAAISIATSCLADTANVSFVSLVNGSTSYVEDGYKFVGALSADYNFAGSAPSLRLYGNVPLTISRVDGGRFSLEAFNLLYQSDGNPSWVISNEQGSGFSISRGGLFSPDELGSTMRNVSSVKIFDPSWTGTTYYVFDSFQLSHVSPVPEPSSALVFMLGLGGIFAWRFHAPLKEHASIAAT